MKTNKKDIYLFPARLLLVLGIIDIVRGFMHTFNIHWAAVNVAKMDLSIGGDQLFLLGVFGLSNFLTGILFIFLSRRAKELSPHIIIIIPLSYAIGLLGFRYAGLVKQAAFNGRYFMMVYMAVCVLTYVKYMVDIKRPRSRRGF